uniref:Uncharacterized protein n=1 Tax=Physcomitrium patens TaxID=3218 RepID=A0A2K1K7B1_PHYPA|nr:hypothetical protein PHYPA_011551 [Physcomitrium patens]
MWFRLVTTQWISICGGIHYLWISICVVFYTKIPRSRVSVADNSVVTTGPCSNPASYSNLVHTAKMGRN